MAVDGVAPRAKMNQQRARRFMSARSAEETDRKAREAGEELPTEARFDNNSITPGTHFMTRLHAHLQKFVETKLATDEQWQGVDVWLSGHDVCTNENGSFFHFKNCSGAWRRRAQNHGVHSTRARASRL